MAERSYAVIGTGGIGGLYGAWLERSGQEVHFLLHSDYEHVRAQGLRIESMSGDFLLPRVHAYRAAGEMPRCDVVLVALKATQNHLLPALLPPVVKPGGAVVLMQNGLGGEDALVPLVPACTLFAGLCFVCTHKVGPGHIQHLDYGWTRFAEHDPAGRPRGFTDGLRALGADFERAGVEVELSPDLLSARWHKLVWNVPFNSLCILLNATTDALMADPQTCALAEDLMREIVAGAAAHGREIADDFVTEMLDATRKMVPYWPSMKLDFDAGRPMEVEAIFGNPVRAAQAAGAPLRRVEAVYRLLKFLDGRKAQTRPARA